MYTSHDNIKVPVYKRIKEDNYSVITIVSKRMMPIDWFGYVIRYLALDWFGYVIRHLALDWFW